MHKEQLLTVHESFVKMKDLLVEVEDGVTEEDFEDYHDYGIKPEDDHRPKDKHERAIFLIGMNISDAISDGDMGELDSIGNRMEEFANDAAEAGAE